MILQGINVTFSTALLTTEKHVCSTGHSVFNSFVRCIPSKKRNSVILAESRPCVSLHGQIT